MTRSHCIVVETLSKSSCKTSSMDLKILKINQFWTLCGGNKKITVLVRCNNILVLEYRLELNEAVRQERWAKNVWLSLCDDISICLRGPTRCPFVSTSQCSIKSLKALISMTSAWRNIFLLNPTIERRFNCCVRKYWISLIDKCLDH